jgi:hypothetical protein
MIGEERDFRHIRSERSGARLERARGQTQVVESSPIRAVKSESRPTRAWPDDGLTSESGCSVAGTMMDHGQMMV